MLEAAFLVLGAVISFAGLTYAMRNATRRRWVAYVDENGRRALARVLTAEPNAKKRLDLTLDPGDGGAPVFVWDATPRAGLEPDASVTIVYDERTRVGMLEGPWAA